MSKNGKAYTCELDVPGSRSASLDNAGAALRPKGAHKHAQIHTHTHTHTHNAYLAV